MVWPAMRFSPKLLDMPMDTAQPDAWQSGGIEDDSDTLAELPCSDSDTSSIRQERHDKHMQTGAICLASGNS